MTVKECYDAMGGDYEDVVNRLRRDDRIQKFLCKIPDDPNYELLCTSIAARDMKEAFRAAHTMKGITQNLSITKLNDSTNVLTEQLRNRTEYTPEIEPAFAAVKADYNDTVSCIRQLIADISK